MSKSRLGGGHYGFPPMPHAIGAGAFYDYQPTQEQLDLTLQTLTIEENAELKSLLRLVGNGSVPIERVERYVYETAQRWFGDQYGFADWFSEQLENAKTSGRESKEKFKARSVKAAEFLYGKGSSVGRAAANAVVNAVNTAWTSVSEGAASSLATAKAKYGQYREQRTTGNTLRGRQVFYDTVCKDSLKKAESVLKGYTGMTEDQKQIFAIMQKLIENDPICVSYKPANASMDRYVLESNASRVSSRLGTPIDKFVTPRGTPRGSPSRYESPEDEVVGNAAAAIGAVGPLFGINLAGQEIDELQMNQDALKALDAITPIIQEVETLTPAEQINLATETTQDEQLEQLADDLKALAEGQNIPFNDLLEGQIDEIGDTILSDEELQQVRNFIRANTFSEEELQFMNQYIDTLDGKTADEIRQQFAAASATAVAANNTSALKVLLSLFLNFFSNVGYAPYAAGPGGMLGMQGGRIVQGGQSVKGGRKHSRSKRSKSKRSKAKKTVPKSRYT